MSWGVFERPSGFVVSKILLRSPSTITVASLASNAGVRMQRSQLRAEFQTERAAHDLYSRLQQSKSQMHQAERQARERHEDRVKRLIVAARRNSPIEERAPTGSEGEEQ